MKLRLPYACQAACALCAGTVELDATAVESVLRHAEQTGQGRVYVHGTVLTLNPHLRTIARVGKLRALEVILVEDGTGVELPACAQPLQQMGVTGAFLSLPSGAQPDAWKPAFAVLLALHRSRRLQTGMHVALMERSAGQLQSVLRLQARLGIRDLLLSDVSGVDGGLDATAAVTALENAWLAANTLQVRLHLLGFERARHAQIPLGAPAPACDGALLDIIRRRIPFRGPRAGIRVLGGPDHPSNLQQLVRSPAELRELGLELAARSTPAIDLPRCLGGTQSGPAAAGAGPATGYVKSDACSTCPIDHDCLGASEHAGLRGPSSLRSVLRPLSTWYTFAHPPRVLILSSIGGDLLFYMSTLLGLADILRQRGAWVELVSPWLPRWNPHRLPELLEEESQGEWMGTKVIEAWLETHDLRDFDLVVTSDFWAAGVALATGFLSATARMVVVDFHMLEGMQHALSMWLPPSARAAEGGWWPAEQLILESAFPAYVQLYRNYGVPLAQMAWRPFALDARHFPPGPDVHAGDVIFSGGDHLRDLDTLRAATERLPRAVHPVDLYAFGERFEGNAHLRHQGSLPVTAFYQALARSRFVVLPVQEDSTCAAGITVVVMALMAGRPVVASGIAAIRDYVRDGAEGLLVPPGDPDALAEAITRLDTDPALLSALAAGARAAGSRLSTQHWAEEIVSGTRALGPLWTPHGWRNW